MKTFWIVLLVAFLVFIIVNAIRGRHYSSAVYRARFFSRMPRERQRESNRQDDSIYVAPVIFGAATDGAHPPDSAPNCETGVADSGGACSAGGDGGGASS